MSLICVQLGQCGNQIATQLFSTLHEDSTSSISSPGYRETALNRFFHSVDRKDVELGKEVGWQARAVLVDMESKVVHHSLAAAKKTGQWMFDDKCVYSEKQGSGNNWANGYLVRAPSCKTVVMEMVRRQAERCDHLDGFLVLMSVAGGTGSGVGARITEYIKDAYPGVALVNPIIWPYPSGEVIVQDYNSLLTTSHLQTCSDAILLLQNEQLHKVCTQLLHMRDISLANINSVVAHSLSSILQPATPHVHDSCDERGNLIDPTIYSRCRVSDLVTSLCPHPFYKFLSLKTVPQMVEANHAYTHYLWAGLLKHMRQMLVTDSPTEEGMDWTIKPTIDGCHGDKRISKSLANLLVLRGRDLKSVDVSLFQESLLYSCHTPSSRTCSVWCSPQSFNQYEKCCTLLSNSQSCVGPLDNVCGKAWSMFSARAYVHQYERFGLTQEDFMDSFVAVEQVVKDYRNLK